MINISPIKIMVIITVILVLLGPDKLPEVARKLGSSWHSIKRIQQKIETEVREAIPDLPSSGDIVRIVRNPVHLLDQLANRTEGSEEPERWSPDSDRIDPHEVREDAEGTVTAQTHDPATSPTSSPPPVELPFDPSLN
jgi:TatA/E family protein of Tat protein translocase